MIVILLGAPGAGKGTQAKRLAETRDLSHVSTGDLLRDAVDRGTPAGLEAKEYMSSGRLVPDDVMLSLVAELMDGELSGEGIILDGFPRTVPQAEGLERILSDRGLTVDCVLFLDIEKEEVVRRLSARVSCPKCGKVYNLLFNPPETEGVCDECGGELVRREDDQPEKIEERFRQYRARTEPLIDYYGRRQLLRSIDAGRSIDEIQKDVDAVFETGCGGAAEA